MTGIDFIALQVRDIDRAAEFYETTIGLTRTPGPPGAVVFDTEPIPFAVRTPLPGTDLDAGPAGLGVALWLAVDDARSLHDTLDSAGVELLGPPEPGPFGVHFTFRDLDGYAVTVHDAQQP